MPKVKTKKYRKHDQVENDKNTQLAPNLAKKTYYEETTNIFAWKSNIIFKLTQFSVMIAQVDPTLEQGAHELLIQAISTCLLIFPVPSLKILSTLCLKL